MITTLGEYMKVQVATCVGGTRPTWIQGTPIVVGTPGRIMDTITRKMLNVQDVKLCILDEADETLSHGFQDQLFGIFKLLPSDVQARMAIVT